MCDGSEVDEDKYSVDSLECLPKALPHPPRRRRLPRLWNCEIDESELTSKGLQVNDDGSFSRSPRGDDPENLPFVMSPKRVALIRKRKEERSAASAATASRRSVRTSAVGDNLTDAMKEVLYKKTGWNRRRDKSTDERQKKAATAKAANLQVQPAPSVKLPVIRSTQRRLSYVERYQKENGFDPTALKGQSRSLVKDTVRSNYGDTERDSLSDVSSRLASVEEDENEETFYKKIMAGEKNVESVRSLVSGKSSKASSGRKKEVSISRSKKKQQHVGQREPAPLPKATLLSRARAYGNLANTRNLVKLQMRSSATTVASFRSRGTSNSDSGSSHRTQHLPPIVPPTERKDEVEELPWETRNLLLQISDERDAFRRNMNELRAAARQKMTSVAQAERVA